MMKYTKRMTVALLGLGLLGSGAQAQFYKPKGAVIAVGGTGQFETQITSNATGANYTATSSAGGTLNETATGQQQFTTESAGFLATIGFHPVTWAGIEVNYGYTHYSERYSFNTGSANGQTASVPTTWNEGTAAYQFHPKHIKFQPFVNLGGGAISFLPRYANNQWRWTGLAEVGFDIPTPNRHLAFRVQGRGLAYRAPNFNIPAISTRSWRVTEEPSAAAVFRF